MRQVIISVVFAATMMLAAIGGSYALALQAVQTSQHNWCSSLLLLTHKPVPRTAGAEYQLYVNLLTLENRFDCGHG